MITSGEKKWGRGKTGVGNEKVQTIIYKINKHSQSYGFSSGMYGCESWTIKKAEH